MGESGTGKTLILSQALGIKVSKYRRLGKRVNVIVLNYVAQPDYVWHDKKLEIEEKDNLLEDLKNKYLAHLTEHGHLDINIRFASLRTFLNGAYVRKVLNLYLVKNVLLEISQNWGKFKTLSSLTITCLKLKSSTSLSTKLQCSIKMFKIFY